MRENVLRFYDYLEMKVKETKAGLELMLWWRYEQVNILIWTQQYADTTAL
jgi:hypothetical protein